MHERFNGYLLDGQQRLTAISLVRAGHEDYRLLFSLWLEPEEDKKLVGIRVSSCPGRWTTASFV